MRKLIIAATVAVLAGTSVTALAKSPARHQAGVEYGNAYVPYGAGVSGDRHNPTDTNGF